VVASPLQVWINDRQHRLLDEHGVFSETRADQAFLHKRATELLQKIVALNGKGEGAGSSADSEHKRLVLQGMLREATIRLVRGKDEIKTQAKLLAAPALQRFRTYQNEPAEDASSRHVKLRVTSGSNAAIHRWGSTDSTVQPSAHPSADPSLCAHTISANSSWWTPASNAKSNRGSFSRYPSFVADFADSPVLSHLPPGKWVYECKLEASALVGISDNENGASIGWADNRLFFGDETSRLGLGDDAYSWGVTIPARARSSEAPCPSPPTQIRHSGTRSEWTAGFLHPPEESRLLENLDAGKPHRWSLHRAGDVMSCAVHIAQDGAVVAMYWSRNGEWPQQLHHAAAFKSSAPDSGSQDAGPELIATTAATAHHRPAAAAMLPADCTGLVPAISVSSSVRLELNFGERPFSTPVPPGFLPIHCIFQQEQAAIPTEGGSTAQQQPVEFVYTAPEWLQIQIPAKPLHCSSVVTRNIRGVALISADEERLGLTPVGAVGGDKEAKDGAAGSELDGTVASKEVSDDAVSSKGSSDNAAASKESSGDAAASKLAPAPATSEADITSPTKDVSDAADAEPSEEEEQVMMVAVVDRERAGFLLELSGGDVAAAIGFQFAS
jgi:hypothetical protein